MYRLAVWMVVFVSSLTAPRAQELPPPSVTLERVGPLPLAAQATRTHLLGTVEIYRLGLYVEGSVLSSERLVSPDVPKALRIDVTYVEDLNRRLPYDWRRELVPLLEAQAAAHLRAAFAGLRRGDVVLVDYVPDRGTTVHVNRGAAVFEAPHNLMLAFLDHWGGQRPVSQEMKDALLHRRTE